MRKVSCLLPLLIIATISCVHPDPSDFPPGDYEPRAFCIDFEQTTRATAVNGVDASSLYSDLGIIFPSQPIIFNQAPLCDGFQCLYQGDIYSARPELSCGPLEIWIHPYLRARKVEFQMRNVGLMPYPIEMVATAYGERDDVLVEVDEYWKISRSDWGSHSTVEQVTLESSDTDPPIKRVIVNHGTCPPNVAIDNLCISPKDHQVGTIGQTDAGANRLVYYFDNRQRHSYIQVANLSNSPVDIHVQIWIVNSTPSDCNEIDFIDNYSANDVHSYDMSNLIANNTSTPISFSPEVLSGKYGFVVVSRHSGPSDSLLGVMRIIDDAGYEYRTNAVAPESVSPSTNISGVINFNNANGNRFSELIGFTYSEIPGTDTVYSDGNIVSVFGDVLIDDEINRILIFDEDEDPASCSQVVFSCNDGSTNIGIDHSMPNNRMPEQLACITSRINHNNSGVLLMPFNITLCSSPGVGDEDNNCLYNTHFVGFIGINNGEDSGSFDSWWGGEINE